MKNIAILTILCTQLSPLSFAQDLPTPDTADTEREQMVIAIDHLPVGVMEETLQRIIADDLTRILGEPTTNRLVVDAPRALIPQILGLVREIDRPRRNITITVTELVMAPEVADNIVTGRTEMITTLIEQLQQEEAKIKLVDQLVFSVCENEQVTIQTGEQTPIETGRVQRGGSTIAARSFEYSNVGRSVTCTPRLSGPDVLLDFEYEKSEIVSTDDKEDTPPTTVKTQAKSTLRIANGTSFVVTGIRRGPDAKPVRWKLIVSAREDDLQDNAAAAAVPAAN